MSEFGIPSRSEDSVNVPLMPSDLEELSTIPESLRNQVSMTLNYYREQVNKAKTQYDQQRVQYLRDVRETYTQFQTVISMAIFNKTKAVLTINGTHGSPHVKPYLDDWYEHNKGKAVVIREVIRQCQRQGWEPSVKINDYDYDYGYGCYSGGDTLIFECSFKK